MNRWNDHPFYVYMVVGFFGYLFSHYIWSKVTARYWRWRNRPRVVAGPMPSNPNPYR